MNSRNYGLGTRDMAIAGRLALQRACDRRELSFSSVDTISDRWSHFAAFVKEKGIGRMENIDMEMVINYGHGLAEKVKTGEMSASYAQNRVSAVNKVMSLVRGEKWRCVSPTKDCSIDKRCAIRKDAPAALDRGIYEKAVSAMRDSLGNRLLCIVRLARELGLRSKEASLLNSRKALDEAKQSGFATIFDGTKGGRKRKISITTEKQLQALSRATGAQRYGCNLIPKEKSWKEWRDDDLRKAREIIKEHTNGGLRDLRSAFACELYQTLTGHAAPVSGGEIIDREVDLKARKQISAELGHGRVDVVSEYIGGRS